MLGITSGAVSSSLTRAMDRLIDLLGNRMAENIEIALSKAFRARAAAISADQLEYKALRPPHAPARRPVADSLQRSHSPSGKAPLAVPVSAAASGVPGYVGARWLLSSVDVDRKHVSVPASYRATIEFRTDGALGMSDSVNYLFGHYTLTAAAFITSGIGSTLALYAGDDAIRRIAIAAMDTIAYGPMTDGRSAPSVTSTAHLTDDRHLVITAASYRLTFLRSGNASTTLQPPPTPRTTSG